MEKTKVLWLGVQPTSYNYTLYKALKQSSKLDVLVHYSLKFAKSNPYQEKYYDDDDYFFNEKAKVDFNIIKKAFDKNVFIVSAGWDNKTKLLLLLIRASLGFPYAVWTDSVNTSRYKVKNTAFRLKQFICRKATIIFTTGQFGINKIVESGLVEQNSKIVSLPFFVGLPQDLPAKDFQSKKFNVLQLCRLIDGKGVEITIDAFSILKKKGYTDINLAIGGTGPNEQKYKELISKSGVEDMVELAGWVNAEKLAALRAKSLLVIHPVNNHDPFPLVVLESLANGIPVIGSSLAGSVVERIKDNSNGFVIPPNSAEALADKILSLYNDRNLLKQLSIVARKGAEEWPVSKGVQIVEEAIAKFN